MVAVGVGTSVVVGGSGEVVSGIETVAVKDRDGVSLRVLGAVSVCEREVEGDTELVRGTENVGEREVDAVRDCEMDIEAL